jgi:NAD(P)-dependent dehydrogenase (short-subunit alcohol dehydrogenase family)
MLTERRHSITEQRRRLQVAAAELGRYGVRVNAIAPLARTRLTVDVPVIGEMFKAPEDPDAFDAFHPRHVSPLVAYLATEGCPVTGKLFSVQGGAISECTNWAVDGGITTAGEWSIEGIAGDLCGSRV